MNRKEEIILTTLELAAENGLGSVSMAQIAEKLGIKKPSLYNHFKSKDEMINEMYRFLREETWEKTKDIELDDSSFLDDNSLEDILLEKVSQYNRFVADKRMMHFFKVLYSERATNPLAAQMMVEETNRMILAIKNLFHALAVHGKLKCENVDMAATSYAMTIHSMMDYQIDCMGLNAGSFQNSTMIQEYIKWFSRQIGGCENEKDID